MKLEDQVTSIEISKRLKELGIKQEGVFSWALVVTKHGENWGLNLTDLVYVIPPKEVYSAFTVAELGELLPVGYGSHRIKDGYDFQKKGSFQEFCCTSPYTHGAPAGWNKVLGDTEAEARGGMLIFLLEKELK